MFLKRFYNSLRFWQAIVTQLILPLQFVLIALILAVTLPNANENDPLRPLTIGNSALDPDNRLIFFAELGEGPSNAFDFDVRFEICMYSIVVKFPWTVVVVPSSLLTLWGGNYYTCKYGWLQGSCVQCVYEHACVLGDYKSLE